VSPAGGSWLGGLQRLAQARNLEESAPERGGRMRYSTGAVILHWLIAILIMSNMALAFYTAELPRPQRLPTTMIHAEIGMSVLILSAARIIWRLTHRAPPFAPWLKPWEVRLASGVHASFYALMIAVPLMGWFMASARGRAVSMFGLFKVNPLPLPASVASFCDDLHVTLAYLMIGLVTLHIAGALKHQFVTRDGELARMSFGRGQLPRD
jgi:cytochrome b561